MVCGRVRVMCGMREGEVMSDMREGEGDVWYVGG